MSYDYKKYRLGKLCPAGHEYAATGMSLRFTSNGCCLECNKLNLTNYRLKYPDYNRNYYQNNKKEAAAYYKKDLAANPKKYKKLNKKKIRKTAKH